VNHTNLKTTFAKIYARLKCAADSTRSWYPRRRFLGHLLGAGSAATLLPRITFGRDAATLADAISGDIFERSHPQYEIWRQSMSWHAAKPSRYPDVIVQPRSIDDVIATVKWAAANKHKIAIRGGGHSWVQNGIRHGGVLLDLGHFRNVKIDAGNRSAVIQGSITSRELAAQLAEHNLAFPIAHCGSVAMGGYLLGSGQAWNQGAWGPAACYRVRAIDVITAAGELIRADETHNSDLLWAARGAGPGFPGIVINFHLDLLPLPQAITTSTYMWPLADSVTVAAWMDAKVASLPRNVEMLSYFMSAPPDLALKCGPNGKVYMVTATAFCDTEEQAREALAPLADAPEGTNCIYTDELAATPFPVLFDNVDLGFPRERINADTFFFDAPAAAVVETLRDHFAASPSALSLFLIESRHKVDNAPDAAYSMFSNTFLASYAVWKDQSDDAINNAWLAKTAELLEPLTSGHFISETNLLAGADRAEKSFAPDNWKRLQAVRNKYDPHGVLHSYITPAEA